MLFSHNGRAESAGYRQDYKGRGKRVEAGPRAGRIYTIADVKVDPISFFNVLWRFRRWANYLDADTIIEGGDYVPHAVEFDSSFSEIVEAMALTIAQTLNAEGLRSPRARAGVTGQCSSMRSTRARSSGAARRSGTPGGAGRRATVRRGVDGHPGRAPAHRERRSLNERASGAVEQAEDAARPGRLEPLIPSLDRGHMSLS
jgi:hypothetical protein